MVETALVEGLLEDSMSLVRALDASDTPPTLAVWYFYEDAGEWRLILAGDAFDRLLPKKEALAYQTVSEAISAAGLQSLSISLVKLIQSSDPLPRALRVLIGTPPDGIAQAHFSHTTLNGIFIKEMVVLRSA